jgi:hypothetical protein
MLKVVVGAAVTLSILFALGRGRSAGAGDHELCWSCGQRNNHKMWCPNR